MGMRRRRHTALLTTIVLSFAIRPLVGEGEVALIAFSFAILVLMLVALYNIEVGELARERDALAPRRRRGSILGWALAVPAIATRLVAILVNDARVLLAGSVCWLLFFAYVASTELRSVLRQRSITSESMSLAISVYLLLGLTWGFLFGLMFQVQPEAFDLGTSQVPAEPSERMLPVLIYFSLTTLSTIGFGDITPRSLGARYAAVAEGITGQFYLAVLVARLVGMQLLQSSERGS